MELPFAVEQADGSQPVTRTGTGQHSSTSYGGSNNNNQNNNLPSSAAARTLQQSETSSLVTASSHGSLIHTSSILEDDDVDDIHRTGPGAVTISRGGIVGGPMGGETTTTNSPAGLPPNTPHDVVLPSRGQLVVPNPHHHHHHNHHQQQQQTGNHRTRNNDNRDAGDGRGTGTIVGPSAVEADFTYVDVTSDESTTDVLLEGEVVVDLPIEKQPRADVLTVLLGGIQQDESDQLLNLTMAANDAAQRASEAKSDGDLVLALDYHTQAAKLYKDNAVAIRDRNQSLSNTLLLLSQTQAKSAIALKRIVKLNPQELRQVFPPSNASSLSGLGRRTPGDDKSSIALSQKDRLRAAVRGALGSKHEADMSDSQFLGRATTGGRKTTTNESKNDDSRNDRDGTISSSGNNSNNPVDEMFHLERELREMDMVLELGSSVSSLDTRVQNRMKNSMIGEGSFMFVPPGSNSYMSSTSMWNTPSHPQSRPVAPTTTNQGSAGVRARANRVQNMLEASSNLANRPHVTQPPTVVQPSHKPPGGLEESWWGNASTTILSSSMVSVSGGGGTIDGPSSSSNTKQIMRLMDSLKTMSDENAQLIREVEERESAKAEAKAAREEMKRFKVEYQKRFSMLKKALDKSQKDRNKNGGANPNDPISTSDFMKSASVAEQLQRQEALIRKLTADLKTSKEESKKKDSALRKYESFYREVKARSAQKAAQRNQSNQQSQQHSHQQQRRKAPSASRR